MSVGAVNQPWAGNWIVADKKPNAEEALKQPAWFANIIRIMHETLLHPEGAEESTFKHILNKELNRLTNWAGNYHACLQGATNLC